MLNLSRNRIVSLLGLVCVITTPVLFAAELPAGTVIEKANLDQIKNDTFDGHTIGSLLTEKIEWQVRNWGLKITLDHAKPIPLEPIFVEATKKNSGQVKFDSSTKEVTGYTSGLPFPSISESDPDAGYKIMWNFYYAPKEGDIAYNKFLNIAINKSGIETTQDWIYQRYYFKGRWGGDKSVVGDGSLLAKTFVLALAPEDIKGLGTFGIRYDTPQFEDTWIYLRSARRVRRLSGGAWMDPIGGADFLTDDLDVFNARPSWYPQMKLIGKRWVLAITDANKANRDLTKKGMPDEFPYVDLKHPPYWNPIEKWQPREVYVIEAIPPAEHPYSKRLMYVDTKYMRPYYSENFDKKGEFWKLVMGHFSPQISEDGYKVLYVTTIDFIDFKRQHASVSVIYNFKVNPKGVTDKYWSLSTLEQLSK